MVVEEWRVERERLGIGTAAGREKLLRDDTYPVRGEGVIVVQGVRVGRGGNRRHMVQLQS